MSTLTATRPATPAGRGLPAPPVLPAGRLAGTVRYHRRPLRTLTAARRDLGDVVATRMLTTGPIVVVMEPDAATRIAAADPAAARAGDARRRILPPASPASVFGGDGDVHARALRHLMPVFSADAIAARRHEIGKIAEQHVRSWPTGRPVRLLECMRRLTDDVTVRLLLGVRDEALAPALAAAIRRLSWTPGNPPLTVPDAEQGLAGAAVTALYRRRLARVAGLLADVPGARELTSADTPAAVADELAVVLLAAQDPPSIALARLLDRAAREPSMRAAVLTEPEGDEAGAAIRETLRLHPPASGVLRRLDAPVEVAGRVIPAGARVLLPLPVLHRDPEVFAQPDRFEPGRFARGQLVPDTYLPFGAGARRCLGEALAWALFAEVLPTVLRHVELRPLARRPERMVVRGTVLVPQRGLLAQVRGVR